MNMTKIRPQILVAIISGTVFATTALFVGLQMEAVEVVTGVIGSIFGFLGGVAFKVLENEQPQGD